MQSLSWYFRRLQAMTPKEIMWRTRCAARDAADRHLYGFRTRRAMRQISANGNALQSSGFAVSRMPDPTALREAVGDVASTWIERLRARADRIAANRLDIFDLVDHDFGDRIDWNRDPKSGKSAPKKYAPLIDYRDFDLAGDCKLVWEPNRHHQLVVLGRAYQATGDTKYAEAAVKQWLQWLEQCPYAIGMNWRSGLELGIRLINWVWAIGLLMPSGKLDAELRRSLLHSAYLHLWDISRNYSRGSSAGNHRIGEAAGVFIASCYFRDLKNTDHWAKESQKILGAAILEQTFPDGGSREQALGYHQFVLQFFLLAGLVGKRCNRDFPEEYWERLHSMFRFIGAFIEGGGNLPLFGDCDDGYVLDLDANPRDVRPWLSIGAALFRDPELKAVSSNVTEAGMGLLGLEIHAPLDSPVKPPRPLKLVSRVFPDSGYYLLQSGHAGSDDRISVGFDCGQLGLPPMAGHGHADTLSFTLRVSGEDILVDPGTYDYFSFPGWRSYFRSTRAHNTIVIDDQNQSDLLGSFMWGQAAEARCVKSELKPGGGSVTGEHYGYARLPGRVIHRRTITLDGGRGELLIKDELEGCGPHEIAFYLHFAEHCRISKDGSNRFKIESCLATLSIDLDSQLSTDLLRATEDFRGGWISHGYHHKVPSTTLVGRTTMEDAILLECRLNIIAPWLPHK